MKSTHPSDELLRDYLKDIREDMSWRRELEFRLLQFLLVFYPIIGTAIVTLYQSQMTVQVYWIITMGACFLILAAAIFATDRVCAEHKAFAEMGQRVQKIWAYFGLFEAGAYLKADAILPERLRDPKLGYGQGQGYKKTLALIWLVAGAMTLSMLTLAVLKGL